ncbi:MAG: recombinase family protein, partial [Clostridia bacterium]|nr:recombinase family protein [Clostridia bacterium]
NPESVILESVLEGMAEYYSLNLSREVRKGLKENALAGKTTGGRPPLGYDIDPDSKRLVINTFEASAVKLIFKMYLDGCSYGKIISELNTKGYKTKRNEPFGKNSIHSILKNPKYTGLYTYNLEAPKYSESGKPIRYAKAENDNLIQIEGAVPAIISKEDFETVQKSMLHKQHKAGCYNAKIDYLLSGKIFCGECNAPYTGNRRKANSTHPEYNSYRCSKRNGKNSCSNKEIRKEYIEELVLQQISGIMFSKDVIPKLYDRINTFLKDKNSDVDLSMKSYKTRLKEVKRQIDNLVSVIAETGSKSVVERLNELEKEKILIENQIETLNAKISQATISKETISILFGQAKRLFENGTLESSKKLIDLFVEKVIIYKDHIEIKLNILPDDNPRKTVKNDNNSDGFFDFLKHSSIIDR